MPDAEDTLNSIWLADADILYCSPQGLQNMLETSVKPESPKEWRKAVEKLNQAHTGAAPVSEEKAECYERHGLLVFQVFATTEAGLLFFARKDVTGHTTWLKPLPPRKEHMLFRKQPNSDVHELWLKDSFPGLLNQYVRARMWMKQTRAKGVLIATSSVLIAGPSALSRTQRIPPSRLGIRRTRSVFSPPLALTMTW